MSKNGVSALERGYRRTPQRETLALLAGALALDDAQRVAFEAAAARWELLPREKESSVTVGPWPRGRKIRPAVGAHPIRRAGRGTRRDCITRTRASAGHGDGARRRRQDADGAEGCSHPGPEARLGPFLSRLRP